MHFWEKRFLSINRLISKQSFKNILCATRQSHPWHIQNFSKIACITEGQMRQKRDTAIHTYINTYIRTKVIALLTGRANGPKAIFRCWKYESFCYKWGIIINDDTKSSKLSADFASIAHNMVDTFQQYWQQCGQIWQYYGQYFGNIVSILLIRQYDYHIW